MKCSNCGANIKTNWIFCPFCAAKLIEFSDSDALALDAVVVEEDDVEIWEAGDLEVEKTKPAIGSNIFIVRSVREDTLRVSDDAEYSCHPDAGDGYIAKTRPVWKNDVRKIV